MEFISNYPWYYTLLCLVAGFVFSAILYIKDKQNAERSKYLLYGLATLRFLSISLIALLLLDIFIKRLVNETEKPIIILAQDNSTSLIAGKDSTEIKNEYTNAITSFVNTIKDKYDVKTYQFDSESKPSETIDFKGKERAFRFKLSLSGFKHVGIFPEQASNWLFIEERLKQVPQPSFLNLFAYTGAASIVAKAAGAEVTHVDSIKQVVTWANENQELSNLKDIKWVVEDALKFVKREVKRGKKYNGIILDPPAFGHGPNGEKWKLEDSINEIMKDVAQLADPDNFFLILNTYSLGFSSLIVENLIKSSFKRTDNLTIGELYLQASKGAKLPLGVFGKIQYIK
jgi:23S rRNA (cytosine1962-C5)-methyltransferase